MVSDADWADLMRSECENFRLTWSEFGIGYLNGEHDQVPAPPPEFGPTPNSPGHSTPRPGVPVYPDGQRDPSPDVVQSWERIDAQLVRLFETEFLSGRLDDATAALDQLQQAPLGEVNLDENKLEQNREIDLGDASGFHVAKLREAVDEWEGNAAKDFNYHLIDLEYALAGCQDRVSAAWRVMAEYKSAIKYFRDDIMNLIDNAHGHIQEAEDVAEQVKKIGLANLFTTVPALASIPITGGATAAMMIAWGQASSTLSAGRLNVEALQVGSPNRGEVVHNLVRSGDELVSWARDAATVLGTAAYSVTKHLTETKWLNVTDEHHNGVRTTRPRIVTDEKFDPHQFRHDDHSERDLADINTDDLVTEPPKDPDRERDHNIENPDGGFFDDAFDGVIPDRRPDAYQEQ